MAKKQQQKVKRSRFYVIHHRRISVATTDASDSPSADGQQFRWPVRGRIISGFGTKPNGEKNDGINLAVPEGTSVKAAEAGVSRAAAAYSWIMAHPSQPIPIVGTQTPARIAEIPDAFKPRWTRAEWYAVLVASMGENLP